MILISRFRTTYLSNFHLPWNVHCSGFQQSDKNTRGWKPRTCLVSVFRARQLVGSKWAPLTCPNLKRADLIWDGQGRDRGQRGNSESPRRTLSFHLLHNTAGGAVSTQLHSHDISTASFAGLTQAMSVVNAEVQLMLWLCSHQIAYAHHA